MKELKDLALLKIDLIKFNIKLSEFNGDIHKLKSNISDYINHLSLDELEK